jgi:predicted esterase
MADVENIGDLMAAFTEHYRAAQYAQALEVLDREGARFPAYVALITTWRATMCARTGDTASALSLLEQMIGGGGWIDENAMRGDSDFAALHDSPDFQALAERSQENRLKDVARTALVTQVMEPRGRPAPWPLLIPMHGHMGNLIEFAPYWQIAPALGWLVTIPQSTQHSWLGGFYVWDDIAAAMAEIEPRYQSFASQYPVDRDRVVLAGYSGGGNAALHVALSEGVKARGYIGIEPWIADFDILSAWLDENSNPGLRVYLFAGQNPDFVDQANRLQAVLSEAGIACGIESTPVKHHGFPADFDERLRRALDFVTVE